MNTSRSALGLFRALAVTILLAGTGTAVAAETPAAASPPSKEMREKMAAIHEKMAACLRSDKAFSECQREMHQRCSETMGEQGCPMMGKGMGRMMTPPEKQ